MGLIQYINSNWSKKDIYEKDKNWNQALNIILKISLCNELNSSNLNSSIENKEVLKSTII